MTPAQVNFDLTSDHEVNQDSSFSKHVAVKTFPNVSRDVKQQIAEDIESRVTSVKSGNTRKQITVSLTSSSDVESSDSFIAESRAKDLKNQ